MSAPNVQRAPSSPPPETPVDLAARTVESERVVELEAQVATLTQRIEELEAVTATEVAKR